MTSDAEDRPKVMVVSGGAPVGLSAAIDRLHDALADRGICLVDTDYSETEIRVISRLMPDLMPAQAKHQKDPDNDLRAEADLHSTPYVSGKRRRKGKRKRKEW